MTAITRRLFQRPSPALLYLSRHLLINKQRSIKVIVLGLKLRLLLPKPLPTELEVIVELVGLIVNVTHSQLVRILIDVATDSR